MPATQDTVDWYVHRNGEPYGPLTGLELAQLAGAHRLSTRDLIWCTGMSEWVEAGTVPGLLPAAPPEALPPPRPFSFSEALAAAGSAPAIAQADEAQAAGMEDASDWAGDEPALDPCAPSVFPVGFPEDSQGDVAHEPQPAPLAQPFVYEHIPVAPRVTGFAQWLERSIERAPSGGTYDPHRKEARSHGAAARAGRLPSAVRVGRGERVEAGVAAPRSPGEAWSASQTEPPLQAAPSASAEPNRDASVGPGAAGVPDAWMAAMESALAASAAEIAAPAAAQGDGSVLQAGIATTDSMDGDVFQARPPPEAWGTDPALPAAHEFEAAVTQALSRGSWGVSLPSIAGLREAFTDGLEKVMAASPVQVRTLVAQVQAFDWDRDFVDALAQGFEKAGIETVDDLMNDDRVRDSAKCAMDVLPFYIRWSIALTIGAKGFDARVLQIRDWLLTQIGSEYRAANVSMLVRELLCSENLNQQCCVICAELKARILRMLGGMSPEMLARQPAIAMGTDGGTLSVAGEG